MKKIIFLSVILVLCLTSCNSDPVETSVKEEQNGLNKSNVLYPLQTGSKKFDFLLDSGGPRCRVYMSMRYNRPSNLSGSTIPTFTLNVDRIHFSDASIGNNVDAKVRLLFSEFFCQEPINLKLYQELNLLAGNWVEYPEVQAWTNSPSQIIYIPNYKNRVGGYRLSFNIEIKFIKTGNGGINEIRKNVNTIKVSDGLII